MELDWRVGAVGEVLTAAENASPVEAVEAVSRALGLALGASAVSFLIADLSGRGLVRLAYVPLTTTDRTRGGHPAEAERWNARERAMVLPFDGGPEEQAVVTQEVRVVPPATEFSDPRHPLQWRVLAPVTERGEVIGLLEFLLPDIPSVRTTQQVAHLAHLLAFVVIANRRHTDLYEWGQRTRPLSLSAEIQHRLLPGPQTCEAGAFTLAAWLEPSAQIAGDTFDFSLDRDLLHLSLTDAMGHGVAAALSATLCVGSLRNTRYVGATLLDQVATANSELHDHTAATGQEDFVTGLIGRVDLASSSMELVNAGHVSPYLARGPDIMPVELPADLPLGLFPDTTYRSTQLVLRPGDRLVLVTDGMLERNATGLDLARVIAESRGSHPRDAVRAMADRVLEVCGGALGDDATVLCLDWHGDHGRERDTFNGADIHPDSGRSPGGR
ncbi:PP2C family protein-serine/threonine phosphatase [Nocardioides panaciterrulae]|uniref:Serine phosphatase RsbU (Regulator of sigma subunit) n=1 Tax=Nocardioides panaciterrulae TaxID=661492 RepID=A0A7Y9JCX5_9ACTN|nr:PP2C family protein-serine/threonine phosphatase [Nocardioides panaciterrulae]NYD42699.1 serine phosphatase RsbU (regulator of sigma subunit) [Nocardioides panaciterrulae]